MRGPCALRVVTCTIFATSGMQFHGTNECLNAQPTCPRLPGEGYEKCTSICQQQGHAEYQALFKAGAAALGASAVIHGHTYACQACQEALYGAGVRWIGVRARLPAETLTEAS